MGINTSAKQKQFYKYLNIFFVHWKEHFEDLLILIQATNKTREEYIFDIILPSLLTLFRFKLVILWPNFTVEYFCSKPAIFVHNSGPPEKQFFLYVFKYVPFQPL